MESQLHIINTSTFKHILLLLKYFPNDSIYWRMKKIKFSICFLNSSYLSFWMFLYSVFTSLKFPIVEYLAKSRTFSTGVSTKKVQTCGIFHIWALWHSNSHHKIFTPNFQNLSMYLISTTGASQLSEKEHFFPCIFTQKINWLSVM